MLNGCSHRLNEPRHEMKHNPYGSDTGISGTMVFGSTLEALESVAKIIQTAGIQCFCYHRNKFFERVYKELRQLQRDRYTSVSNVAA